MPKSSSSASADAGLIRWPDMDLAYRLDVIAASVDDAVSAIGAWLYDRAKGGWKTRVFLTDTANPIPLHILGVDTIERISALKSDDLQRAHALAIQGEVLTSSAMLTKRVCAPVLRQHKEIVIWGEAPEKLRPYCETVCYARPSAAAAIFKTQALAAMGAHSVAATAPETLHRTAPSTLRYPTDLTTK